MHLIIFCASVLTLVSFTLAQFPPTPEGVTTKHIASHPGLSISYKKTCICDTKANAWAGYVHMPSSYIGIDAYNVSMFFWYFEARNDPQNAPTTLYFAGGPGESSLYGAANDGGPCIVNFDSNSTHENPWALTANSNMLFIDQPVGSGYSYDTLINSTMNLISLEAISIVPFEDYKGDVPPQNETFYYGTLPSQSTKKVANSTQIAAETVWHFSQAWFSEFPHWKTIDKRINLWGNSYGGFWTTFTGAEILAQNAKIEKGELPGGQILHLDTLGFTNGCFDMMYQLQAYTEFLYNNTYDYQLISKKVFDQTQHELTKKGGCLDLIEECRALGDIYDPDDHNINSTVVKLCGEAFECGWEYAISVIGQYTNQSGFDISHTVPEPFPFNNLIGYFNQEWVQRELGVPVNFTAVSDPVYAAMVKTGDLVRPAGIKALEALLDGGVKVALVYGDRDHQCSWPGAEKISLAANWTGAEEFRNAGYEFVQTNSSYNGGMVRQYGNFSFIRVFESGHDAGAYQPETVFKVFDRAISNKDIATGTQSSLPEGPHTYSSKGPSSSWFHKDVLPKPEEHKCYTYYLSSCNWEQFYALGNGTAKIEDWYVVDPPGIEVGSPAAVA